MIHSFHLVQTEVHSQMHINNRPHNLQSRRNAQVGGAPINKKVVDDVSPVSVEVSWSHDQVLCSGSDTQQLTAARLLDERLSLQ